MKGKYQILQEANDSLTNQRAIEDKYQSQVEIFQRQFKKQSNVQQVIQQKHDKQLEQVKKRDSMCKHF